MNQNHKKALFIGLTTIDIQYFVDKYPEPNTKVKANSPVITAGGPAANAAIAYTYLGGNADFLTCIGQNSFHGLLYTEFDQNNVNIIDFFKCQPFQPIIATVITTTNNGDRTILTHHPDPVENHDKLKLIDLSSYSFVFIDGFYPELAYPVCKHAKNKGLPIIFDGGSWKPQMVNLLPLVDIAICSANYCPPGCKSIDEIISYLKMLGVNKVAISRGAKSIVTEKSEIHVKQVAAIDSLGAGDILHGAFCWYYQFSDFENALIKAAKIATFSTLTKGTRKWMESDSKL